MITPAEQDARARRLIQARESRHFADAGAAADAMGVPRPTYYGHENGSRGLGRSAERYARFFRVSLDWLLTGRGKMRGQNAPLKLVGEIGAGAIVIPFDRPQRDVDLPDPEDLRVFRVRGDSQYPRYLDGELVMVETRKRDPRELVNHYCLCITEDGRWLLKQLRRGSSAKTWHLWSHNAPQEDDVRLEEAYAVRGSLDL